EEKESMAKELAKKYPAIKTYQGYKISDPKSRIALTLTSDRIYLYAFSEASEGMRMLATDTYMFYKISGNQGRSEGISCGVTSDDQLAPADQPTTLGNRLDVTSQTARNKVEGIRTLRLAVVSAGEYGEINGGTQETVLANIVSIVNGLNVISEQDLGIRYSLIGNNDKLIFLNKATDPYNIEQNGVSTNSSYLNTRTQVVIDSLIGKQNYDLGHLFIARNETENPVPYGIGNAFGIGNVGTPEKGSGWSYFSKSTTNELGFIGLVSHEFGHHLGATHTFSNQPDGLVTQSELSSGRSLMSYGKINQPDLHYYHYHSIHQIIQSFKRTQFGIDFSAIGTFTPYSQQPPANISLTAYHIPIRTPFVLATPTGLENSTHIYNWEQLDSELVLPGSYWGPKSQKAPLFSSTSPSANPKRYFPSLARVISNELTSDNAIFAINEGTSMLFETLPEVPRQMTFGLTVRDGSAAQGVYLDSTQVTTVANSKPFSILTPFTSQLNGGNPLTIEWEISNTNDDPIKATQVNILLSVDGGVKFDYLLAEKTANDGSQTVVIPNVATTNARIKIEPVDHIFYTINPTDFAINTTQLSLFSSATAVELTVCNEYKENFNLQVQRNQATAAVSNISFTGAPAGLTIALSKNQVAVNELFTATVSNQTAAPGTYTITLKAELNGTTVERPLVLSILSSTLSPVTLTSPAAGGIINQNSVELKWDLAANTQKVLLQISKNQDFSTLVVNQISYGNRYLFSPLATGTTYYWRVYAQNACATSEPASSSFSVDRGYEKLLAHNSNLYDTSGGLYPIQVTDSNTIKEVKISVSVAKDAQYAILKDMTMSLINPS
uniref:reprolysin-like metallopeptidase n=1 Tax=Algoriphagus sp. TaxID=1872435 RepID=UPI004048DE61